MKKREVWILIALAVILAGIVITITLSENKARIFCTDEQRNAEACIQIYQPVCGHVQVECIKEPCDSSLETFPNNCVACQNERVEYYFEGECNEK